MTEGGSGWRKPGDTEAGNGMANEMLGSFSRIFSPEVGLGWAINPGLSVSCPEAEPGG